MNKNILVSTIIFSAKLDANIENKLIEEYRSLYKSFCQLIKMVPRHDAKYALNQLLEQHPEFIGKYTVVTDDIFGMHKIVGNYNGTEYHAIFTNGNTYLDEYEKIFSSEGDIFNNIFGGSIWDIAR